jgi:hypothetical protein
VASQRRDFGRYEARLDRDLVSIRNRAHSACQKHAENHGYLAAPPKEGWYWISGPRHRSQEPLEYLEFAHEFMTERGPPSFRKDDPVNSKGLKVPLTHTEGAPHGILAERLRPVDSAHWHTPSIPQYEGAGSKVHLPSHKPLVTIILTPGCEHFHNLADVRR